MIDCSKCKNCYPHDVFWGEFWCKEKEKNNKDGIVYDAHDLKARFKTECPNFKNKFFKNDNKERVVNMDNILNWNLILHALSYKIQQLEEEVMICYCCEEYTNKLNDVKAELSAYKDEYKNVLIAQQKSNK